VSELREPLLLQLQKKLGSLPPTEAIHWESVFFGFRV
jgi:hypothetical protein